ncbi:hypothetical protein GKZ68_16460 [Hymenobacter sp. BRD128]|uniref:hypothetical protein n=1 Tax=Hymenobacter sp. BRD128 TaxID=2675878 RepID=UPI0015634E53|nr:hypothetical protein [Hymenobacter sp. BRD128]QKG58074.1 hypothetical protein GKZ68_16460 [Hymenobacter sp. BRD128]
MPTLPLLPTLMRSGRASHGRGCAVWGEMMRPTSLFIGMLAGLLLCGCRISSSHAPGYKEAVRTNAISNKHLVSEPPALERPAPRVGPDSATIVH